jgi:hypothetical protein
MSKVKWRLLLTYLTFVGPVRHVLREKVSSDDRLGTGLRTSQVSMCSSEIAPTDLEIPLPSFILHHNTKLTISQFAFQHIGNPLLSLVRANRKRAALA